MIQTERPQGTGTPPTFAVVVPAHDAAAEIAPCLRALTASGFGAGEILVVDDGSRDGTGDAARAEGVRVLRHPRALGPALARNAGAAATDSDVILFVDADVVVHPGARDRLAAFFAGHPDHDAIFGSYDDSPGSRGAVGIYRNLLHHWVHQTSRSEAQTFWAGFGAVRRDAFLAVGGFDPAWSIEDVELGLRLRQRGGRIRLERTLLCKHLKDWTLRSMVRTDWKVRAVPWARLLLERRTATGDLNLSFAHRLSGAITALIVLTLAIGIAVPPALALVPALLIGFAAANAPFLRFLARRRGWGFAARSLGYHLLHYAAADLGYLEARLGRALRGPATSRPPSSGRAALPSDPP